MSTHLTIESDRAVELLAELCALTSEDAATAVLAALRQRLARVRAERPAQAAAVRAAVLGRAIRAHAGPGIPVNHCWDEPAA